MKINKKPLSNINFIVLIGFTLVYWYWESRAEGNIRVDLLLIYPFLFLTYIITLWSRFKYYSLLMAIGLMALNFFFLMISYDLFNKHPG